MLYRYVCAAAYGVGLLVTFGALAIMGTGQPALLYIVPLTLGTAVVVGWLRKELHQLWIGEPVSAYCCAFLYSYFSQCIFDKISCIVHLFAQPLPKSSLVYLLV